MIFLKTLLRALFGREASLQPSTSDFPSGSTVRMKFNNNYGTASELWEVVGHGYNLPREYERYINGHGKARRFDVPYVYIKTQRVYLHVVGVRLDEAHRILTLVSPPPPPPPPAKGTIQLPKPSGGTWMTKGGGGGGFPW